MYLVRKVGLFLKKEGTAAIQNVSYGLDTTSQSIIFIDALETRILFGGEVENVGKFDDRRGRGRNGKFLEMMFLFFAISI